MKKGIILAGGNGTRLHPLTFITNKHLLPVYDKPMILYPLETLRRSGISEIRIVCGGEYADQFRKFLGKGGDYGVNISYAWQERAGGIAEALGLAEDFLSPGEQTAVILGDNVFEDEFRDSAENFKGRPGARVFLKEVPDPERFGIAEISGGLVRNITEKPASPKSRYAATGIYFYDRGVFDKIRKLKPSPRGELEITDLNNLYAGEGLLSHEIVRGFWSDAGTIDSLLKTAAWAAEKRKRKQ